MKNKKIILLGSVLFIAIIAVTLLKYSQLVESLEEKVRTNCNSYKEYWKFDYISVKENMREIEISLTANDLNKGCEYCASNSPSVCREITDYLFSEEFEYAKQGYHINFIFVCRYWDVFHVEDIYPEMKEVKVRFHTDDAQLKDVAEWYPETEFLTIEGGDFQLDDLAEFKNLSRLWIRWVITHEEKEQILSICPDVNLLDTKIKDE